VGIAKRTVINRFELLLEPFGLSGPVSETTKRGLFELNQVRNSLMHRAGKADRRLIEACPWLNLSAGQTVNLTGDAYKRYQEAAFDYVTEIIIRIGERFGVDMEGVGKKETQESSPDLETSLNNKGRPTTLDGLDQPHVGP
jgi:hypothetical protein